MGITLYMTRTLHGLLLLLLQVGRALGAAWGKLSLAQKASYKQENQDQCDNGPSALQLKMARVLPPRPKPKPPPRRHQVYGGMRVTEVRTDV